MGTLEVFAAYDGESLGEVPLCDRKAITTALKRACATYQDRESWLPSYQRIEILEKLVQIMESRQDQLSLTAATEGGKPLADSAIEVARAIVGVKIAINQISQMTGTEIPMNLTPATTNRIAYTYREPVGVVVGISAFNHPVNLIVHQVIPAVAVGCPVIIKPASTTPLSCINLVNMLYEAGLPEQWCQVVICENANAEYLATDPRVSFLSFIGSSNVGWYLRSKLSPGATCALEHGGAAPVIVEADADLADTLPLLTKGGFYHAGQVCVSVQRVFAHQKISKQLSKQLAERASNLVVGDPRDKATEVGPLIAKKEVERVDAWVKQARHNGAKVLCGGAPLSDTCYQPTVLLDPPFDVNVSTKEIFGPVVCVYTYKDRLSAIEQANKLPFFFQAAIFTKNIEIALDSVKRLNANTVLVNDHTAFRADWMPFGGRKHSGLSLGGVPYSMHDMTYEKMMVIRSSVL